MNHFAVRHPIRLYAEPIGLDAEEWALVAEDASGNKLTIIASGERFRDALMSPVPKSHVEQVRDMYVRDEVPIEVFERELERG